MPSSRQQRISLKKFVQQILHEVAKNAALVERLLPAATAKALDDARLDLVFWLERLYWLMPAGGTPWIHWPGDDGERQWSEVTDTDDRTSIIRWAALYAPKHGIDLDKDIERFYKLLGPRRPYGERAAATAPVKEAVLATMKGAVPRLFEALCIEATTAQTTSPYNIEYSTSKSSGALAGTKRRRPKRSVSAPAAPASPQPTPATLAETAVANAPPEPKPAQPPPSMSAISAAAGPALVQASVYLLQHVFPIASTSQCVNLC